LERANKYYEQNKEKVKQQRREYYEGKKNIISEKSKEKVECECGSKVCRGALRLHLKTAKHQEYVKTTKS
jgi:hypothetical protein